LSAITDSKFSSPVILILLVTFSDQFESDLDFFNFKMREKDRDALSCAKLDYLNLANAHICDFLQEGAKNTMKNLKDLKIEFSGISLQNPEEAFDPGKKIFPFFYLSNTG